MTSNRRFPPGVGEEFSRARIVRIRAGGVHRYTGVWVVVVDDRVFVRTWNNEPTGWYQAFRSDSAGSALLNGREIAIRGRVTRSERLRATVSEAYAAKYRTRASKRWAAGLAAPEREVNTLELLPASDSHF
jgi:hypothetical protein